MVKIFDSDNFAVTASKIWNDFEVFQSCTIKGFVEIWSEEIQPKGYLVVEELRRLDMRDNTKFDGRRRRRKKVILPNTVGGQVAHKIFKYKSDENQTYVIWRIQ